MKYFCALISFLVLIYSHAQSEAAPQPKVVIQQVLNHFEDRTAAIDSLIDLVWDWRHDYPDEAVEVLDYSIEMAEKEQYLAGQVDGNYTKSVVLNKAYRISEAKINCKKGITLAKKLGDQQKLANQYSIYAIVNQDIAPDSAFYYLEKALEINYDLKDTINISSNLNEIALFYQETGQDSMAIVYFKKIIFLTKKIDFKPAIAGSYNNMGNSYSKLKNFPKALESYQKAMKVKNEMGDTYGVAGTYSNIGRIYTLVREFDNAQKYLEKSLELYRDLDIPGKEAMVLANIGNNHLKEGNTQEALKYTLQAKQLLDQHQLSDLPNLEIPMYNQLYKAHKTLGNSEKALEAFEEVLRLELQQSKDDYKDELSKNQVRYETALKEKKIDLLSAENDLKDRRIKEKGLYQNILILSVISVMIILILIYIGYRRKQKTEVILADKNDRLEEALQEKKDLLIEVNHRVKNNLQTISAFLEMQLFRSKDRELEKALKESVGRVRAMSLIHKAMETGDSLDVVSSDVYLKELLIQLQKSQPGIQKIQLHSEIEPFQMVAQQAISIGLIVNELVTNAYKYAFTTTDKGEVSVRIELEVDTIKLHLSDNGLGAKAPFTRGTGLRLVHAFVNKMKGHVEQDTTNGTKYTISLPLEV